MLNQELISHASGNSEQGFTYGFVFYSIRCFSKDGTVGLSVLLFLFPYSGSSLIPHGRNLINPILPTLTLKRCSSSSCVYSFSMEGGNLRQVDLEVFEDDWLEVQVQVPRSSSPRKEEMTSRAQEDEETITGGDPGGLKGKPGGGLGRERKGQHYKGVYLDVDLGKKSERQEWGHLHYQQSYKSDEAFELVVQWVQATGSIITDLVNQLSLSYNSIYSIFQYFSVNYILIIINWYCLLGMGYFRFRAGLGRLSSVTCS